MRSSIALCIIMLSLFLWLVIPSIRSFSSTGDEGWLIRTAEELVKTGEWESYDSVRHPPLSYYTYGLLLSDERDPRRNLVLARTAMLIYPLLLGALIFMYARRHFGRLPAAAALFLFATNPTVLAHSSLITTDVCAACTFFLAFLAAKWALDSNALWKAVVAGGALGLALLAKYTGILLLPLLLLLFLFSRPRRFLNLLLLLAAALLLLNAAYFFTGSFSEPITPRSTAVGLWPYASTPFLVPAPYFLGLDRVMEVMELGHPAFFMGSFHLENRFHFYPAAFLLKEPIPFILLVLGGMIFLLRRKVQRMMILPVLVAGLSFMFLNNNFVGVRHLLVIYPFLFVAAAAVFRYRGRFKRALWLLPAAQFVSVILVAPHYLAYFNEAAGGPEGGSRHLLDSNFDWGQDYDAVMRQMESSDRLWKENPGALPTLGCVAVSAMDLRGYPGTWPGNSWLAALEPKERVGYTWQLYEVSIEDFEDPRWLGWACHEVGDDERALNLFRETGDALGELTVLLDLGEMDEALKVSRRAMNDPASDAPLLDACALAFEDAGDTERTEQCLHLAAVAEAESRYLGGVPSLDPASYAGKDDAVSLNNLGYLKWRKGDTEEAIQIFLQAVRKDQAFADPWGNIAAVSYELASRCDTSFAQVALGAQPRYMDQGMMSYNASMSYQRLYSSCRGWWAKRVAYRNHVAVYPGILVLDVPSPRTVDNLLRQDLDDQESLGVCFMLGKDEIHAFRAFRSALSADPDLARSHYHLGVIWFRHRCYRRSLECLERALALEPGYGEARKTMDHVRRYLKIR